MIYFALTVLALRTVSHLIKAMGVKFEEKLEKNEHSKLVNFIVHSILFVANLYILLQFISIK